MSDDRYGNGSAGIPNLSLVVALSLLVGTNAKALSPVETHGALSIQDSSLVDSSKKVVALRGVSLCDHNMTGCKEFLNKSAMQFLMTDWRASSFRVRIKAEDVALGGATLKGAVSDTGAALAYARRAIAMAVELGTYVVVDWQSNGLQTDAAKAFFGKLAREYGNTPNILWEICGEPNGVGGTEIANYAKSVMDEIRPHSGNVVIVGTSNWSQNPQEAGTELKSYGNVAYTFHFNAGSPLSTLVTQAKAKKNAVLATEWYMAAASGEGGFQSIEGSGGTNIKDWVARLDSDMVSHWNASLGNRLGGEGASVATECALKSGVSFQGGWGDPELTESGLSIRGYLRAKNPQWTLPDTTTRIIERSMVVKTAKGNPVLGIDTVIFTAQFNRPVSWTVTETGLDTKATRTTKGAGMVVDFRHVAGAKDLLSPSFIAGGASRSPCTRSMRRMPTSWGSRRVSAWPKADPPSVGMGPASSCLETRRGSGVPRSSR